MTEARQQDIEAFINSLPDPAGARTFLERLESSHPTYLNRIPLLLVSRLLTIASYSPFLAETLLLSPEHIDWLKRESERDLGRVKSSEQLSEELGRFSARVSAEDEPSRLARFKRRELLRIYLRDCLGLAALSELTEELSNLADVILTDALGAAHQEMVNRYGAPSTRDKRGRIAQSEIAIVALGKLGCRELNYASDVDLLFLYSGEGRTSGDGGRADTIIENREFFRKVASFVVRIIGTALGEAPVYRVDLRLRPYGREGDIVSPVEAASDYYRHRAQSWERQALIRARGCAGSSAVVADFFDRVRDVVFHPEPLPEALADVRRLKEKIDRQEAEKGGGFNVKLGRGGIREIEFITQALQLAHGGREPWVRSAQTLIVLARLAEKGHLSEPERSRLSAAYTFLRTVEHRLQMEHGVHTHTLPVGRDRLELVARRCGYTARPDPAAAFQNDLQLHISAVRSIYNRVFHQPATLQVTEASEELKTERRYDDDETARLARHAADASGRLVAESSAAIERVIAEALPRCINPVRSLRNFTRWAESLATYAKEETGAISHIFAARMANLVPRLLAALSSQYLAQMIVSRPVLAAAVADPQSARTKEDFLSVMRVAIGGASDAAARADALRHIWYEQVVEIGYRDLAAVSGLGSDDGASQGVEPERRTATRPAQDDSEGTGAGDSISCGTEQGLRPFNYALRENNLEQTALAEASLQLATEISLESLGVETSGGELRYAILGLGRLGHTGMDYGSDLDLLVVFDDQAEWEGSEAAGLSLQEFYGKFAAQLVRTLSSVTREGFIYRIDLRLRPDGQSGPIAQGLSSLLTYLGTRASAWEHSAYLKGREVAGDLTFGARVREAICEASFDAAALNPSMGQDLAHVRARLEREKARPNNRNIKWGPGGMTDVYFITRYLQLRDRVKFPPERGTSALISHLGETGRLDLKSATVLFDGYGFLRRLDHWMRLLLDRPSPVMPSSHTALGDLARALGLGSVEELERRYAHHTGSIRGVYDQILSVHD